MSMDPHDVDLRRAIDASTPGRWSFALGEGRAQFSRHCEPAGATLQARAAPPRSLPESIEWAPAGRSVISATKGGMPWRGTVEIRPEDARRLDAQLQRMLREARAGRRPRPFIDFDHQAKAAAAHPVRFFWEDGIRLEVEWTTAGQEAVEGSTYGYVSPEFILADDGRPESLPPIGPIGSLVNAPAFQRIKELAAA